MPRAFVFVKPTGSEFVIIIILEALEPLTEQSSIFTAILKYVSQEYIDFKNSLSLGRYAQAPPSIDLAKLLALRA